MNRQGLIPQLLFGGVIGANILTMSLMNFFEWPTRYLTTVYLACAVGIATLLLLYAPQLARLTKRQHVFCSAFAVILFLPRLAYLVEWLFGYAVNFSCYDDFHHLQEISSIVYTPTFPPRSTLDHSQYLSYYYAAWMLGAALYKTGLLVTVKQALGLNVLVYCFFFTYGVMYASHIVFNDARLQRIFLMICVSYGGFDFFYWLSGLSLIPSHSEWWAQTGFGISVQYSNFFTLALWVQQHTLAAFAIFYALFLIARSTNLITGALAGIFLLSSLFSSVFVWIGALPLMAWYLIRSRHLARTIVCGVAFLILSIPLWWIFLGKPADIGFSFFGELDPFWMERKRAAFVVFLLILSLELMPLLAAAYLTVTRERLTARIILFALCVLYLLSTFIFYFPGGNNYAMRGSIVPIFTLIYLGTPVLSEWLRTICSAPSLRSIPLYALTAAYLAGGLLEYSSFSLNAIYAFSGSNTDFNVDVLHFNEGDPTVSGSGLAARTLPTELQWYLLERERPNKQNIDEVDRAVMGSGAHYRVTAAMLTGRN